MRLNKFVAGLAGALALSGCATTMGDDTEDAAVVGPSGNAIPTQRFEEPMGTTLERRVRIENVSTNTSTDGVVNTLHFYNNGTVLSVLPGGDEAVQGRWMMRGNDVCFTWPVRGQECWPNAAAMQSGQAVTITSDRGVTARMTGL